MAPLKKLMLFPEINFQRCSIITYFWLSDEQSQGALPAYSSRRSRSISQGFSVVLSSDSCRLDSRPERSAGAGLLLAAYRGQVVEFRLSMVYYIRASRGPSCINWKETIR